MTALRPMELLRVDPAMVGSAAQLSVDRTTGAASARIPLPLTPGRDGFGPSLALVYSGYDPLSPFAHGWSLAGLPSIDVDTRDGLPRYDGQEKYRFAGQELVPLEGARPHAFTRLGHAVQVFSARVESSVVRVERWTESTGRIHFRVRLPDGSVQIYGRRADGESRIADPPHPERTFRWLLEAAVDRLGNAMAVRYQAEDGVGAPALGLDVTRFSGNTTNRYPKRILYGNAAPKAEDDDPTTGTYHFEAVFDYGDHDTALPTPTASQPWAHRQDAGLSCRAGFEIRTRRLCRRILMFHRFPTELGEAATLVGSLEMQLTEAADASTLTGTRFIWWRKTSTGRVSQPTPWSSITYTARGGEDAFVLHELPALGEDTTMVDLFGEGLPGLFTRRGNEVRFARNLGGGVFGAHELITGWPAEARPSALLDFDGDGNLELAQLSGPSAGFYRFDRRTRSFELLRRFESSLSVDSNVLSADMTGDGRPDLVLLHARGITLYSFSQDRDQGAGGFGEPIEVTLSAERLPVASGSVRRFLADMTGDGLPDVVEVDRGAVRYYPNLGHGRFGELVWMDSVPLLDGHLEYDPSRVLLADISGTGGADLLYLRGDGTILHAPNQRGASFGPLTPIAWGPTIPSGARVESMDFYGDGGSCLLVYGRWGRSTAGVQVLRLVDAPGPRQLLSATAPLGAVTELTWGHSTQHYLRDDAQGRGWETPLPSHRPVVDLVRRTEPIDGAESTERFRYHDGHFDPRARSFSVFAVTDQFDVDVDDAPEDVVPRMSRRFVHTGEPDYLERFAGFRYAGGGADDPPEVVLAGDARLFADYDEALGALTGSLTREEVFATSTSGVPHAHPLSVTDASQRVIVSRLSDDAYRTGVSVVPSETRSSIYEEVPSDPRIAVQRTVTTDGYLVPTLTLAAGLPRRAGVTSPARFDVQDHLLATASTLSVTHVDTETRFELAIPSETRGYEVHVPSVAAALGDVTTPLGTALASASAYTTSLDPNGSTWAARHLSHTRTFYWNDTRTAALGLGAVGATVLPHHTEQAAYDTAQLTSVFGALLTPATELPPFGYVELSGTYYAKGAISRFGDATTFYRMTQSETFDGGITQVGSDVHRLVATSATDPVGNVTSAIIDYHLLAPFRITDPNGTIVEVDYDPLGVTRRTSRYGQAMTSTGTLVDHGFDALTLGAALPTFAAALSAPEASLAGAETLFLYEYPSSISTPMRTLALRAEQLVDKGPDAGSAPQRAQVSLSYHDGFGRPLQSRMLVEPGTAWVDVAGTLVEQTATTRWRVSGYVELDAKQQARKTYEPFFRGSEAWEPTLDRRRFGVASTTDRDALGRTTQVSFPNGTFTTTAYSAWSQSSSDPNDTSSSATAYIAARTSLPSTDPEKIALTQALSNASTPVSSHLNALGHAIAGREVIEASAVLVERASRDVRGLSLATIDRRGLTATSRGFDRLGRGVFETSMDAGTHRSLFDAEGREVKHWHEGTKETRTFDVAGRLTHRHVTSGATTWLAEQMTYGEGAPSAADKNQLGRLILVKDAAGTQAMPRYGAFGEPLEAVRTMTASPGTDPDWSASVTLESTSYTTKTALDALGRPTKSLLPDGTERRHQYLRSGPTEKLEVVTPDAVVRTILASSEYNARGQEIARELGNAVDVASTYDAETFRLHRRYTMLGTTTYQDLRHHYDPVGNLVFADDLAQRPTATHVINGLGVTAERVFSYDARYQLTSASGRVHNALTRSDFRGDTPTSGSFRGTRRLGLNDGGAVSRYLREYEYDAAGNLLGWSHGPQGGGSGNSWVHDKWVSSTSNRSYLALDLDNNPILNPQNKFDAKGQIIELPNLRAMEWSPRSQLRRVVLIDRTSPTADDDELYDYAADGKRLRKTTRRLVSGNVETTETLYLDGCELRKIKVASTPILERWSSHVEAESGRVATLYRWTLDSQARETSSTSVVRTHYHLGSNVGNVSLELGPSSEVIGYEEYFPYGGTAFVAGDAVIEMSFRTLRFAGKDQDDATGFCAFHFRYYAPYLGTWVSPDPAGEVDGPNQYWYARNNPATVEDPLGLLGEEIFATSDEVLETEDEAIRYFNSTWGIQNNFRITDLEAAPPGDPAHPERHGWFLRGGEHLPLDATIGGLGGTAPPSSLDPAAADVEVGGLLGGGPPGDPDAPDFGGDLDFSDSDDPLAGILEERPEEVATRARGDSTGDSTASPEAPVPGSGTGTPVPDDVSGIVPAGIPAPAAASETPAPEEAPARLGGIDDFAAGFGEGFIWGVGIGFGLALVGVLSAPVALAGGLTLLALGGIELAANYDAVSAGLERIGSGRGTPEDLHAAGEVLGGAVGGALGGGAGGRLGPGLGARVGAGLDSLAARFGRFGRAVADVVTGETPGTVPVPAGMTTETVVAMSSEGGGGSGGGTGGGIGPSTTTVVAEPAMPALPSGASETAGSVSGAATGAAGAGVFGSGGGDPSPEPPSSETPPTSPEASTPSTPADATASGAGGTGGTAARYRASPARRAHILDGDPGVPGAPRGHGHGPNRGLTRGAFPDTWTDDQAIAAIERVTNSPDSSWEVVRGPGQGTLTTGGPAPGAARVTAGGNPARYVVRGYDHGLRIEVIVEPFHEGIITGYPRGGGRW